MDIETNPKSTPHDTIINFQDLVMNYTHRIDESILANYSREATPEFLTFYKMIFDPSASLKIYNSLVISKDLHVRAYFNGEEIEECQLPESGKLQNYSALQKLLENLLTYRSRNLKNSIYFKSNLALSISVIEEILKTHQPSGDNNDYIIANITTVLDQLRQIKDCNSQFSPSTITSCLKIYEASPEAYAYLRTLMYLPDSEDLNNLMATSSKSKSSDETNDDVLSDTEDEEEHVCF